MRGGRGPTTQPNSFSRPVTLGWFRGPGGVALNNGTNPIDTFDGKPTPVGLRNPVGSLFLKNELSPLVLVGLHKDPVSNLEGFAASLHALVE